MAAVWRNARQERVGDIDRLPGVDPIDRIGGDIWRVERPERRLEFAIRSRKELAADWRSAALGIFSAAFFAFAAIGFRSAVIGVASPSRVLSASVILVLGLAIQSAALGLYLALFDRGGARAILDAWRSSLFAGLMGALASQLWFVAFALSEAAPVRTLALIEVPMAQVVSLKMFREPPSLREGLGISLIVIAAGILVWTAR
jgi:drug/metabolite transporter (DMT)-like permease